MTIGRMIRNAMNDDRAKAEMITTAEMVGAFILPIFGGFFLIAVVFG